jgi:5-methylcytosine-specific restriction endonuclease McrA
LNSNSRYVITFPQHPRASKAKQVKAHIIAWEIANKKNLPMNCGIFFKDGNSLNIQEENLDFKPLNEIKSIRTSLYNNIFWKGGKSGHHNYYGGWRRISKENLYKNPVCKICNNTKDLLIHHILPYSLFNNYKLAHSNENLLVVCRHCHGKIHYNLENSWRHIDENQYEKLLKLLEHLKSQSSDTDLEIFRAIEQQIEQTDNQQPSFLTHSGEEEGSETIPNGSRVIDNSKKEDSL